MLINKPEFKKKPLIIPKPILVGKGIENLEFSLMNWNQLGFEFSQAGENSIWVRAIPAIFRDKIQGVEDFIPKLLKCINFEECIHLIVCSILETQTLQENDIPEILTKIANKEIPEKKGTVRFYRTMTLSEGRSVLLGS